MKKYLSITKGRMMESTVFRAHTLVIVFGNIIYLFILYFLWKAIFAGTGSDTIKGMTFTSTFIYLAIASSMFTLLNTWTEWGMSRRIISGVIILDFLKPVDYQLFTFFTQLGSILISFFLTFIPTCVLIYIVTGGGFSLGVNVIVFLMTLILAMLLNFVFDFIIGTICFYTESTWGLSMTKEVLVLLLSGAVVPLAFFPENIRLIVDWLPFQAIYNLPLQILINDTLKMSDYVRTIGIQVSWLLILVLISRLFLRKASKVLTVNGG